MVEWRIGGTTSVDVDADLRRRRESTVYVRHSVEFTGEIWRSRRTQATVREHRQIELDPLRHSQPM